MASLCARVAKEGVYGGGGMVVKIRTQNSMTSWEAMTQGMQTMLAFSMFRHGMHDAKPV